MKRQSPDQLREQVDTTDRHRELFGHAHVLPNIALVLAHALINISETLEDIAASLDRERLSTL